MRVSWYFPMQFQSTPPLRAVTRFCSKFGVDIGVSIHTALAGGDEISQLCERPTKVSIHTALAGGDCEDAQRFRAYFVYLLQLCTL